MNSPTPISALRLLLRIANAFTLDLLAIYRDEHEFTDALILAVLLQRQVAAAGDEPAAISVNALAASLGLPFETIRRRTKRLIAAGVCAAVDDGVCISAGRLASAAHRQAVAAVHDTVRTLHARLLRAGCIELMDLPAARGAACDDEASAAIVWRGSIDYFLRTMEILLPNTPGIRLGFVIMEVVRANTAEFSDAMRGEERFDAAAHVPDEHRAPVRASAVAARLRLPHETVRRCLHALAESERCQAVPGGYIVPGAALARPAIVGASGLNFQNLRRLFCGLAEAGVLDGWLRGGRASESAA